MVADELLLDRCHISKVILFSLISALCARGYAGPADFFRNSMFSSSTQLEIIESYEKQKVNNPYVAEQSELVVLGALFVCDPFCQYLGLVTSKGIDLEKKASQLKSDNIRYYDRDSEIFKAYFEPQKIESYEREVANGKRAVVFEKFHQDQISSDLPENAFEFWKFNFEVELGLGVYGEKNQSSDYGLNIDLDQNSFYSRYLSLLVSPQRTHRIFQKRFKSYIIINNYQSMNRESTGSKAVVVRDAATEIMFLMKMHDSAERYWLSSLSYENLNISVDDPSPRLFGEEFKSLLVGFGYEIKNISVQVQTNVHSQVSEKQRYRADPFDFSIYKVSSKLRYPYILFEAQGAFVLSLNLRYFEEKASLDPEYLLSNKTATRTWINGGTSIGYAFPF